MRLPASCSSLARPVLDGPERAARVLGVADSALYLQAGTAVLAVVTSDAVRLPCAAVLAPSSELLPLRYLTPDDRVLLGRGRLGWRARGAGVTITLVREWAPARVTPVRPRADRVAELRRGLHGVEVGIDVPHAVPDVAATARLLGRGPGLTPSGDDLLAGFLLGCRAFGRDPAGVAAAVTAGATRATTALSAGLLRHALAGSCVPQVAALTRALGAATAIAPELSRLLRVGHTSGAALAHGISLAADAPARSRRIAA